MPFLIDNNGFDKNVTYEKPGHIIIAFTNKTEALTDSHFYSLKTAEQCLVVGANTGF